MQDHYNLIYREEEREMLPFCLDQGVGVLPWSPLAPGSADPRPWTPPRPARETDEFGVDRSTATRTGRIVDAVLAVAADRELPPAQVALAWLLDQPAVTSPIVGVTKPQHLADAVAAADLDLTADEVEELSAGYLPHAIAGHQ